MCKVDGFAEGAMLHLGSQLASLGAKIDEKKTNGASEEELEKLREKFHELHEEFQERVKPTWKKTA